MSRLLRGTIAGVMATGFMTAVMFAAEAVGLLRNPPPRQITANAERNVGTPPHTMPQETFNASWLAAHVAYGMAAGSAYIPIRLLAPGPSAVVGLSYGLAVWAVNYLGLMPALGLYPWPSEDTPHRTATMIVAHVVYGVSLGELVGEG